MKTLSFTDKHTLTKWLNSAKPFKRTVILDITLFVDNQYGDITLSYTPKRLRIEQAFKNTSLIIKGEIL